MAFDCEHVQHITHYLRTEATEPLVHDTGNSQASRESDEYTQADYPGILDTQLTQLTPSERIVFITLLSILCLLSLCGNVGTMYVNFRRKIRPFFRACLISLALSDLVNTAFLTAAYSGQFTAEYVQVWRLGSAMCNLVPFVTTAAILASSMTLVGIALDRYFAVMKAVISFWNPGVLFCVICMCSIWGTSIGIAVPVLRVYDVMPVYILSRVDGVYNTTDRPMTRVPIPLLTAPKPETTSLSGDATRIVKIPETSYEDASSYVLVKEQQLVSMCISDQKAIVNYYVIVFAIIFVPCIFAFIWLNSVIAKKLWTRRHKTTKNVPKKENIKSLSREKKVEEATNAMKNKPKFRTSTIELMKTTVNIDHLDDSLVEAPSAAPRQYRACQCRLTHSSVDSTVSSSIALTKGGGPLKMSSTTPIGNSIATTATARERRHIRMFTIIILLMAVFLLFRLPAWIFLIIRMYGSYSKPNHWMLYFTFGILNCASCALNPLFYTFLSEAIKCVLFVKTKVYSEWCGLRQCRRRYRKRKSQLPPSPSCNYGGGCDSTAAVPLDTPKNGNCCFRACACFGKCSCFRWLQLCYPAQQQQVLSNLTQQVRQAKWHSSVVLEVDEQNKQKEQRQCPSNIDKDEGVECSDASDASDDDDKRTCDYGQRIYTIFPPALVSSSVISQ